MKAEQRKAEEGGIRRSAGRLAGGFFLMLALSIAAQLGLQLLLRAVWPEALEREGSTWALVLIQYGVGIPAVLLCAGRLPARTPERQRFSAGRLGEYFLAGYALLYLGNLAGTLLSQWISALLGHAVSNPAAELSAGSSLWMNLALVSALAPLAEEFLFRKLLLERLLPFGEKGAVMVSALAFGLFHGNLYQFFYAFGVGVILGLAYVRSGRFWFPVLLHMGFNFMGSVAALWVLGSGQPAALLLYLTGLLSLVAAGLAFLLADRACFRFRASVSDVPGGQWRRAFLQSPGTWLFLLGCGTLFALNLL